MVGAVETDTVADAHRRTDNNSSVELHATAAISVAKLKAPRSRSKHTGQTTSSSHRAVPLLAASPHLALPSLPSDRASCYPSDSAATTQPRNHVFCPERVADVAGEAWISKVFGRLRDDEARARAIFTDEKIKDTVTDTLSRTKILYRAKDGDASRARRLEAYETAAKGEWEKALLLFSQAVLRAPPPGKCEAVDRGLTLPLALLGRAEVFAALNEYALALEDLRLAEEEEVKLSECFRGELSRRRAKCEERIRSNERRAICPRQCEGAGSTKIAHDEKCDAGLSLLRLSGGSHPRLPAVSALLDVRETPHAGKQAIAVEEIGPGDTLVVEPPLAACLLPEFFGTRCHHCFSGLRGPVGCPDCSSVAFCGRMCRDQATASYHKYECPILALLIGSGMSALSMLALRMITQAGPIECENIWRALRARDADGVDEDASAKQWFDGYVETQKTETESNSCAKLSKSAKRRNRRKMLRDSKYQKEKANTETEEADNDRQRCVDLRAYELVMHESKRTARDFFERSLMAAFLLKCLQTAGFFGISSEPDRETERNRSTVPTGPEIAVAALLLKHLQLLQFNAHEVFETRPGKEHQFRGSKPVYIGVAIYPTVARFNHDCYPAVTRYFAGRSIVIRATRSLRVGDTVAENYGPIFTKRSLEQRRRTLAGRYWFACECTACRENWPGFETLTNDNARLRCPTEGCEKLHRQPRGPGNPIDCSACRRKVDLREPLAALRQCELGYEQGFAAMEEEQPDKALDAFLAAARTFHRIAVPPHRDTHLAEIAASACMRHARI
ncbi:protein-lysine N-methyltransferase SMYD4 isoform X2 [Lasioglossum baleicum]|uniref:protein-lysine N-methyltransferase SMYD4 isoform X2 n=1 Tax=Lasioglossum baleicum TaxID=434251 RepID=UPI003FCE2025